MDASNLSRRPPPRLRAGAPRPVPADVLQQRRPIAPRGRPGRVPDMGPGPTFSPLPSVVLPVANYFRSVTWTPTNFFWNNVYCVFYLFFVCLAFKDDQKSQGVAKVKLCPGIPEAAIQRGVSGVHRGVLQ